MRVDPLRIHIAPYRVVYCIEHLFNARFRALECPVFLPDMWRSQLAMTWYSIAASVGCWSPDQSQ